MEAWGAVCEGSESCALPQCRRAAGFETRSGL